MLSKAQMCWVELYLSLSHDIRRVDDQHVLSGIVFVIRNGLCWWDCPWDYGQHKACPKHVSGIIYNRFIRRSCLDLFNKIFAAPTTTGDKGDVLLIDTTHLKTHSIAASLLKRGFT